jgi:hypothetical protein
MQEMVTPVGVGPFAVGFTVEKQGEGWYFMHGGSNWGFQCDVIGHRSSGYGLAIMTNGGIMFRVMSAIPAGFERAYDWDVFGKPIPAPTARPATSGIALLKRDQRTLERKFLRPCALCVPIAFSARPLQPPLRSPSARTDQAAALAQASVDGPAVFTIGNDGPCFRPRRLAVGREAASSVSASTREAFDDEVGRPQQRLVVKLVVSTTRVRLPAALRVAHPLADRRLVARGVHR